MFQTVPLPIIRIFSLYTQQRYMSYRFADCLLLTFPAVKNLQMSVMQIPSFCDIIVHNTRAVCLVVYRISV